MHDILYSNEIQVHYDVLKQKVDSTKRKQKAILDSHVAVCQHSLTDTVYKRKTNTV